MSASFGADVWDAKNYGQVMYAIKTRNGEVYMRMQRRGGDMSILEVSCSTNKLTAGRAPRAVEVVRAGWLT